MTDASTGFRRNTDFKSSSTPNDPMAAAPVAASFTYWATTRSPDPSEAYSIASGECEDMKSHVSVVHDIRSSYSQFTLDQHGFMVLKHASPLLSHGSSHFDFNDNTAVTTHYWPETCSLIQSELNARSVVALHSIVRTSSKDRHHEEGPSGPKINKPFFVVHVDYSPAGSRTILRCMLPAFFEDLGCFDSVTPATQKAWWTARREILDAETKDMQSQNYRDWDGANYSGPRWALFSIWRPLEKVQRDPLAVLDGRSLKNNKEVRLPHKNRPGFVAEYEITNMMPYPPQKEEYRWYWIAEQQPDEVYVLKLFDSEAWKKTGQDPKIVPCAAHSAFELPETQNKPARKSVETRVIVVW